MTDKEFQNIVNKTLKRLGIYAPDLARRLEVSKSSIYNWSSGIKFPSHWYTKQCLAEKMQKLKK